MSINLFANVLLADGAGGGKAPSTPPPRTSPQPTRVSATQAAGYSTAPRPTTSTRSSSTTSSLPATVQRQIVSSGTTSATIPVPAVVQPTTSPVPEVKQTPVRDFLSGIVSSVIPTVSASTATEPVVAPTVSKTETETFVPFTWRGREINSLEEYQTTWRGLSSNFRRSIEREKGAAQRAGIIPTVQASTSTETTSFSLPKNAVEGQRFTSPVDNLERVFTNGTWKLVTKPAAKFSYTDPVTGEKVTSDLPTGAKEGDTFTDGAGYTRTFVDGRWKITAYKDVLATTVEGPAGEVPEDKVELKVETEETPEEVDVEVVVEDEEETVVVDEEEVDEEEVDEEVDEEEVDEEVDEEEVDEEIEDEEEVDEDDTEDDDVIQSVLNKLDGEAPGFMYTWDRQAQEEAEREYGVATAEAIKNAVMARNQLAQDRSQALNAFYGGQYSSASKIEKFGWTGGAVTDEKMRMAYLNATINSQMFNQKEMVLAGYDTELSVAREYAQLNLVKLANEKYQQAYANAIGMAEVTGRYMSPEARDVLSNYFAAESNPTDPRNASIIAGVNLWLQSQGITPEEFEAMKGYFKQYISYSNTIPAQQWESALSKANEKEVFRTWAPPGGTPYNYSMQEWANLVAFQKTEGNVWDEDQKIFVPKGTVVVDDDNKDDDNKDDDNKDDDGVVKTATDSDVTGLLDGFNSNKEFMTGNFSSADFKKILNTPMNSWTPTYTAGVGGPTTNINGYNVPGINRRISVAAYNYLVTNWYNK